MKAISLFLLMIILISCKSSSDKKIKAELDSRENVTTRSLGNLPEWVLTEERTMEARNTKRVNSIDLMTVAENGNIFFYASYLQKVEAMDRFGNFRGTAARLGGDPGEFRQLTHLSSSFGNLYLLDAAGRKVEVFNTSSLNYRYTVRIPSNSDENGNPKEVHGLPNGDLLIQFSENLSSEERKIYYSIYNDMGKAVSERFYSERLPDLRTDPTGEVPVVFSLPTDRKPLIAVNSTSIIIANGDQLLLSVYDHSGTYQRSFYYPFEKLDVSRQDVIDEYDDAKMRRAIRGESLPDEWPAMDAMLTDEEGRIWLSAIFRDPANRKWISFSTEGEPLGSFEIPADTEISSIRQSAVFTKRFNPRFYSDQIRIYSIESVQDK